MDQVTLAKNQIRADRWRMLIQTCQQSDQTVVNWCEENDITIKTYYYWLRKLRKQELCTKELPVPVPDEKSVSFKKLEVYTPVSNTRSAVIIRSNGATVEISEEPVSRPFRQCYLHCKAYVRRYHDCRKYLHCLWIHRLSEKYYYSRRLLQPPVVTAFLQKLLE